VATHATNHRTPFDWVLVCLIGSVAMLAVASIGAYRSLVSLTSQLDRVNEVEIRTFDRAWQVRYLDERLTHSAAQYVLTSGDPTWRKAYDDAVEQLDAVLTELGELGAESGLDQLKAVDTANQALIALETAAFDAVDRGDTAAAQTALRGRYDELKGDYRTGVDRFFGLQQEQIEQSAEAVTARAVRIRQALVIVSFTLAVSFLALGSVHRRHRQQLLARELDRNAELDRQAFEQRLDRTLNMAQTEDGALQLMELMVEAELPGRATEILLSDSSTAHMRQVLRTGRSGQGPACGVARPSDCAAIRAGSPVQFDQPNSYDACPHLRERQLSNCSAYCAPVSVMGETVGVLHMVTPVELRRKAVPAEGAADDRIAIAHRIAMRAGERLGVIRAFTTSELQAATDPLTGLLNRRRAIARTTELTRRGEQLTVLYLDLDHFKDVNDTHGHEAGDLVIRQFSKILRDASRANDLVVRWGGEEFVVILIDAHADAATTLYRRVQESLVIAGASGAHSVTVSAGAAAGLPGEAMSVTLARGDEALLHAKANGRNRLVTARLHSEARPAHGEASPDPRNPPVQSTFSAVAV
jgi:diguanylate cyclase (GGDEF)-like protein